MAEPLLAEVETLLATLSADAPAMQALGYRDAAAVLRGELPRAGFAAALTQAHWQYARRQRTWFGGEGVQHRLQGESGEVQGLADALRAWFTPAAEPAADPARA